MSRIYRMNRKLMFVAILVVILVIPAVARYCQAKLGYQLPLVPVASGLMFVTWSMNGLLVMFGANSARR